MRKLGYIVIYLVIALNGCDRLKQPTYFISVHATFFAVENRGNALQVPPFIQTKNNSEILYDIDNAEYYFQKLSNLYHFKYFSLLQSDRCDTLLVSASSFKSAIPISKVIVGDSSLMLSLIGMDSKGVQFVIKGGKATGVSWQHSLDVLDGKSSSLGMINDPKTNRGVVVVVSLHRLRIDRKTTERQLTSFFATKNRIHASSNVKQDRFFLSDQKWSDRILGSNSPRLPVVEETKLNDSISGPSATNTLKLRTMPALHRLHVGYPKTAMIDNLEGTVFLSLYIDREGKISRKKLIRGIRNDLDSAALAAIDSVIADPARDETGKTVSVWVTLPIKFKLQEK